VEGAFGVKYPSLPELADTYSSLGVRDTAETDDEGGMGVPELVVLVQDGVVRPESEEVSQTS
jgi:hypothetical protein